MARFLNPHELDPKLAARIREQIARDDAEAARVRRARDNRNTALPTQGTEPAAEPQLPRRHPRKAQRPARPGRRYRVEFTIYSCQPCDWDNAVASCKFLQDALVEAGWLPDGDGWQELEGSAKAVKVAHRSDQRVVVEITRVA